MALISIWVFTPGGNKIPTILNEVIVDYLNSDGSLQESINKPRFYNDGGTIFYENAMTDEDINIFKSLGYVLKKSIMIKLWQCPRCCL